MRSWRNQNFASDSFIELDKRKHPTINHDSKNDHMYVDIINCPPIHRAACQKASILMLFIHHIGVTDSAVKETTGMNTEELRFRRRIWHFFHREDCKDENRARSWNSTYCSIHGIDWSTRKERWENSEIHGSEKARIARSDCGSCIQLSKDMFSSISFLIFKNMILNYHHVTSNLRFQVIVIAPADCKSNCTADRTYSSAPDSQAQVEPMVSDTFFVLSSASLFLTEGWGQKMCSHQIFCLRQDFKRGGFFFCLYWVNKWSRRPNRPRVLFSPFWKSIHRYFGIANKEGAVQSKKRAGDCSYTPLQLCRQQERQLNQTVWPQLFGASACFCMAWILVMKNEDRSPWYFVGTKQWILSSGEKDRAHGILPSISHLPMICF